MGSVHHCVTGSNSRRPAELAPGELAWANIVNGLENPAATGKARPVILIESSGSAWKTMGLTTRSHYRDGSPRVAIPDPWAVGLKALGWLWSDKLCWTSGLDIGDHIGWLDEGLAFEVIELARLGGPTIQKLLAAAYGHHEKPRPVDLRIVQGGPA